MVDRRKQGGRHTSGKVPLEKTLVTKRQNTDLEDTISSIGQDSHQQTGLTAGTVTNDHELAADLGHLRGKGELASVE